MRLHIAAAFLSGALAQNTTVPSGLEGFVTVFNETTSGFGGNTVLGANPCTYTPNATCHPNSNAPDWVMPGRPLCCSITPDGSLCNPDGEPCTNQDTPAELTGESICTYTPDTTCHPFIGVPICCLVANGTLCNPNGEPCFDASIVTSLNPAVLAEFEAMGGLGGLIGGIGPVIPGGGNMMGSSYCNYSPNITCFPSTGGFPPCCAEDPKPEGCGTGEYPECEKTMVGEPVTAGGDEMMGGGNMMGSSYCNYSPNITCFPSTGGFPPCCAEDPKPEGCGTGEYPECETAEVVPPPSPTTADATAEPTSSSNELVFSLAAIVGAHVVACVTGMW